MLKRAKQVVAFDDFKNLVPFRGTRRRRDRSRCSIVIAEEWLELNLTWLASIERKDQFLQSTNILF